MVDELEVVLRSEIREPFRLVAEGEDAGVCSGLGSGEAALLEETADATISGVPRGWRWAVVD